MKTYFENSVCNITLVPIDFTHKQMQNINFFSRHALWKCYITLQPYMRGIQNVSKKVMKWQCEILKRYKVIAIEESYNGIES